MIDLNEFTNFHPKKQRNGEFSEKDLNSLKGKLPDEVINFLIQEGQCIWDDFYQTVMPFEYHELLSEWGLKGDKCFVFMKTRLGSLFFFRKGQFYSVSPFIGEICEYGDLFDLLLNGYLVAPSVIESHLWENHFKLISNKSEISEDEIFAIDPTIPEGGTPETSKFVIVKLKEHNHKLAEQFEHKLVK